MPSMSAAPIPLQLISDDGSSSSSGHRASTSFGSVILGSEDTLSDDGRLLVVGDSPCPPFPRRARPTSSWMKMPTPKASESSFEESASLLNDPTEKVVEAELLEPLPNQHSSLQNASSTLQSAYRNPRALLRLLLRGLIPSFISSRTSGDTSKPEKLYPTAYLDGMRGLAAFAVCLCHLTYTVFVITIGYGQVDVFKEGDKRPEDESMVSKAGDNNRIIQLPFIRLIYSGPPMVAIFFIISGYALSNKPIKQMRSRQFEGLMSTLSSSIFRRAFRLFLPCIASTFLVFIMVRLGLYELTRGLYQNKQLFRNVDEAHVNRGNTFMDQFIHWLRTIWDFVHAWDWFVFGGSTVYDRHLWTIPVEFRASFVLFLSLAGLAKLKPVLRTLSFVGLALWALRWDRWEMLLFWFGALFAELDAIKQSRASGLSDLPVTNGFTHAKFSKLQIRTPQMSPRFWSAFWLANFVFGMYLCSYPDEKACTTPGFDLLCHAVPSWFGEKYRFWQAIGAIQLMWATTNAKFLQNLFNGPITQYLGKISYAMYLMHGPVIHTFGWGMMGISWSIVGSDTRTQWELGFAIAAVLTVIMIIWAADIFWRVVDIPCVKFARWIEGKVTISSNGR